MMLLSYIRTSVRETACGIVMLVLADLMFLFLPDNGTSWGDFIYLNILLIIAFLAFWIAGFILFTIRYKAIVTAIANKADLDAAAPFDSSFYSQLISGILREKTRLQLQENASHAAVILEKNEYIEQWVHEVKIPISVCELILADIQNLSGTREQMIYELERVKYLVNQVLYSARASDPAQNLDISCFNVKNTLRQVIKAGSQFFIQKNISLDFFLSDETITSDEKWLSYIFTQIIHNAAKYASEDSSVRIWSEKTPGELHIHILNEGIGIRREDLPKIFDKGFVGETGRVQTKSTGIGLYLAKKAADHLGVRLGAESEAGQYAKFSVMIPREYR